MPARRSHRLVQLESKRTAAATAVARAVTPTPTPAAQRTTTTTTTTITTTTPSPTGSPRSSWASAPSLTRSPLSTSDGTSLPSPTQDGHADGNANTVKEPTASALMPPPPLPTDKQRIKSANATTTAPTAAGNDARKRKRAVGNDKEHTGDTTDEDDHNDPSGTIRKAKSHRKTKTPRPASSLSTTKRAPPSPTRKPKPPKSHPSRGPPPNLPSATTHRNLDLITAAANWLEHRDASAGDARFASRLYALSRAANNTSPVAAYVQPVYADSSPWRGAWEARRAPAAASELEEEGAEVLGLRVGPAYRAGRAGGGEVGISEVVSAGSGREVTLWFAAEAGWEVAARKARARAEAESEQARDDRETEYGLGYERRERCESDGGGGDGGGRNSMVAENYAHTHGHHRAQHQHHQPLHPAYAYNYCHV